MAVEVHSAKKGQRTVRSLSSLFPAAKSQPQFRLPKTFAPDPEHLGKVVA